MEYVVISEGRRKQTRSIIPLILKVAGKSESTGKGTWDIVMWKCWH